MIIQTELDRLRFFEIRCIITVGASDNGVLANIRQCHKFMGFAFASDHPSVSLNRTKIQTAAVKYSLISTVHPPIRLIQALPVNIKGISILHQEFPAAHKPKARSPLIAEFCLNLV
ncbi:hypothetical protein D3C77_415310 [compost metagenome]